MWGDDTIFIYFFVDSQSHFRDRALREKLFRLWNPESESWREILRIRDFKRRTILIGFSPQTNSLRLSSARFGRRLSEILEGSLQTFSEDDLDISEDLSDWIRASLHKLAVLKVDATMRPVRKSILQATSLVLQRLKNSNCIWTSWSFSWSLLLENF